MSILAKRLLARAALVVAGLAVGLVVVLLLTEAFLRLTAPDPMFGAARELPWMRGPESEARFTVSSEMGFRPKLGTELYDEWGTLRNEYALEPSAGRTRLLFIGDSVTARGRIVDALRARAGDARFEYWNAGVESFNTLQEIAFYRRFNARVSPDHVILTFHLNDFQTTPVVVRASDGSLAVYAPTLPASQISPGLFGWSHAYRAWVAFRVPGGDPRAIALEVKRELGAFARELAAQRRCLSVVVFPYMAPPARWKPHQPGLHGLILGILEAERIRTFDLLPSLRRALADGTDPQERPGDTWHPSAAVAEVFAEDLLRAGLLDPECRKPEREP